jgi:hypothetical protein
MAVRIKKGVKHPKPFVPLIGRGSHELVGRSEEERLENIRKETKHRQNFVKKNMDRNNPFVVDMMIRVFNVDPYVAKGNHHRHNTS